MTQLAEPQRQTERPGAWPPPPPQPAARVADERAGRWPVVIALILSLLGCGLTQAWSNNWKKNNSGSQPVIAERGALSGMDSYALALMLGGLRGPLVMILWSKVENQKIDRDLEDMDTMIEWIRLLQPEFDTVHIFQIWNKAYNISVMMASTASKYATILDAIDYARRVEQDRPGDLNIFESLTRVFADKLGGKNVTERVFYRRQFREDSMTDDNRKIAYPEDDQRYHRMGVRFVGNQNGPLLDEQNNLIGSLLQPAFPRPANLAPESEWNDGSELQYLKQYQPFPYGLSAAALGFNYAKRAQVAMTVGGQKPLQVSDTVIDSRPGLILKQWAEEESDRGIKFEAQALGIPNDAEPFALEVSTASASLDQKPANAHAVDAAIYSYQLSERLCRDAVKEYERHLANRIYVNPYQPYGSHLDELNALQALASGDRAFLAAMKPGGGDRQALLTEAAAAYRQARARYERMVLKYATEDGVAGPIYRNNKVDTERLDEETLDRIYRQVIQAVAGIPPEQHAYDDMRAEYGAYISRADGRLAQLGRYQQPSVLQLH